MDFNFSDPDYKPPASDDVIFIFGSQYPINLGPLTLIGTADSGRDPSRNLIGRRYEDADNFYRVKLQNKKPKPHP